MFVSSSRQALSRSIRFIFPFISIQYTATYRIISWNFSLLFSHLHRCTHSPQSTHSSSRSLPCLYVSFLHLPLPPRSFHSSGARARVRVLGSRFSLDFSFRCGRSTDFPFPSSVGFVAFPVGFLLFSFCILNLRSYLVYKLQYTGIHTANPIINTSIPNPHCIASAAEPSSGKYVYVTYDGPERNCGKSCVR